MPVYLVIIADSGTRTTNGADLHRPHRNPAAPGRRRVTVTASTSPLASIQRIRFLATCSA